VRGLEDGTCEKISHRSVLSIAFNFTTTCVVLVLTRMLLPSFQGWGTFEYGFREVRFALMAQVSPFPSDRKAATQSKLSCYEDFEFGWKERGSSAEQITATLGSDNVLRVGSITRKPDLFRIG